MNTAHTFTVGQLIDELSKYDRNLPVEVNDNIGGTIHFIEAVDHFAEEPCEDGYELVMLQVNC